MGQKNERERGRTRTRESLKDRYVQGIDVFLLERDHDRTESEPREDREQTDSENEA